MAGDDGRSSRSSQTVAVLLLLCFLVRTLTCFSLPEMRKKVQQDKVVSEAAVREVKTGSILFNGKDLNSESAPVVAAATGNDGLLRVDSGQSNGTGEILSWSYFLIWYPAW